MTNPKKNLVDISQIDKLPDSALISFKTVAAITGNGISTIWRYSKHDPTFPKILKLSKCCTRVTLGDFRAWSASKATA